ncbi:hypothetical protein TVAG_164300 [Trichomonas vaginalis G3]|uniref:Calpain catalytic domain-containing protein n=1 Tax=Trichomonas vaginalis (strain ATCC PRA-98 / G3) TaxID=412133 RepID=A2E1X1_TRIV3|nr:calcium-dependent cysteine-type endopeptidase protein [Trichomonas vaginalis G3]EAY13320.1 hypothetical protein TVAG_164300 [Trichomonas vaginalis G3]KAI5540414.1 calcium-dependent cysteine-type endopeptidase protein [Trichomonas vaginalis G3]|eukprot:XP_001325543.1 hypothetical protein [Trichomonas vaginalis G3]
MIGQYPYQFLLEQTMIADEVISKYHAIQQDCKQNNLKFVDKDFDNSLPSGDVFNDGNSSGSIKLEYLENVYNPDFLSNISSDSIFQGNYQDCFLISILLHLSKHPDMIKSIFVDPDISTGCCCLKFSFIGKPYYVIIDTTVPFVDNCPKFAHPRSKSDSIWFCLVEKAYAKLAGGWKKVGGNPADAMNNIFGIYNQFQKLSEVKNIIPHLDSILKETEFVFLSTFKTQVPEKHQLFSNHSYALLSIEVVNGSKYIHLQDPHGIGATESKNKKMIISDKNGHLLVHESLISTCFESLSYGIFTPNGWSSKSFEFDIEPGENDGRFFSGNGPYVGPLPQWTATFHKKNCLFRLYCIASSKSNNVLGFCMCQNCGTKVSYKPLEQVEFKYAMNGSSIIQQNKASVPDKPYTICISRKVPEKNPVHIYCRIECETEFDLNPIKELDLNMMKSAVIHHHLPKTSRNSPQWYINVNKSGRIIFKIKKTAKTGSYTIFFATQTSKGRCSLSGPFSHTYPISSENGDDFYDIDSTKVNIIGIGVSTSKKEMIDVDFTIELYFDGEISVEKIPDENKSTLMSAAGTIVSGSLKTKAKATPKIPPKVSNHAAKPQKKAVQHKTTAKKKVSEGPPNFDGVGLAGMYKMMEDL